MAEYPIQITKVQPPPLRSDTLARDRLLDWLKTRIHRRVVLVVAEAGYGKTTLMADFSRRTRVRTFWYRLDRGDRDWVPFLAHVLAAVRSHHPEFGSATDGLIRETGTTSPPLDLVLGTLIRELTGLPAEPAALVLDDFHLVEDAPDIVRIVRELIGRGPERMSIVVVSRQTPDLQLARLRSLGEVAELRTDDLRFDAGETSRLFREAYEIRLDDALLAELSTRTEGWAASLQLVRTVIRDRSPSERRAFIHSISGAEGELYDYLAEEVIGDQPLELQQFLMRTSVLEQIDPELAAAAASIPRASARTSIDAGEALGLFGRRGTINRFHVRAHPLVRDFLQERLVRAVGSDGVVAIHRAVARVAEARDWRLAGHHYRAAGDMTDARRVLAAAIETILATGAYAAAEELALALPDDDLSDPVVLVVRSRGELQRGEVSAGLELAERAYRVAPQDTAALLTLMAARILAGDVRGGMGLAELLGSQGFASESQMLGQTFRGAFGTSVDGDLQAAIADTEELVSRLRGTDRVQYLGVSLSNLAYLHRSRGDFESSLASADEAVSVLERTSGVAELTSARLARAMALAQLGDIQSARDEVVIARGIASGAQLTEVAYEAGEIEALLGSDVVARSLIEPHLDQAPQTDSGQQLLLVGAFLAIREGALDAAAAQLASVRTEEPRSAVAFEARRRLANAFVAVQSHSANAEPIVDSAVAFADRQHADLWAEAARTLRSCLDGRPLPRAAHRAGQAVSPSITIVAEAVCDRLDQWSASEFAGIREVALAAQPRWRTALRRSLLSGSNATRLRAGGLLEEIGETTDIEILRRASRRIQGSGAAQLGRGLARRLAARVFVEDLGRVRILVGDRIVEGTQVRRKVLALLCYLLTRNRFACSRDEAMDALWPDADPADSLNSLNQTVYFLRRVLEPNYSEDLSPGYVGQNSETIWLDFDLVTSRSRTCRELVRAMAVPPTPEQALALAEHYVDRFALDFAYEEWALVFREALHRTYLRIVEQSLRTDLDSLHLARGIDLGERVADVEPTSEIVGASLVRLYRQSGSLSAAAEQYGSYARQLREIGVDPPAFEDV